MALQEDRLDVQASPEHTEPVQQSEEEDQEADASCSSQLKGILVVCTGTVLYGCILYILVMKLVYPASLSPFMTWPVDKPNSSDNTTTTGRDFILVC